MSFRVEIQAPGGSRNTRWYAAIRGQKASTFDTLDAAETAFRVAIDSAPCDATLRIVDDDGKLWRIGRA